MAGKRMLMPREILYGRKILSETGELCSRLIRGNRALLVTGPRTMEIAGETVSESLVSEGFEVEKLIVERADERTVSLTVEEARKFGANVVLGVGGGKVIDVAKLSAHRAGIPFISVPTNASHDGICSPFASIKTDRGPESIEAEMPIAIVADTEVISSAPHRFLAAGCGDIIAKLTAVKDWQLAYKLINEPYSEYAATLSEMAAKLVMREAKTIKKGLEESVRIVVKALISCGVAMGIAGSSRPASGSEHMFSHALDLVAPKPALHGEQCGVGTIMMMYLHGGNWEAVRDALKTIGAPTNAYELGIEPRYVVEALTIAHKVRDRYTILGDRGLTREAAERLAKETEVI